MSKLMRAGCYVLVVLAASCASAGAANWWEWQAAAQEARDADRRGDFERAATAAERCVAASNVTNVKTGRPVSDYSCTSYVISALRSGRGLPRDERRAFSMLRELAQTDPDGKAALDLAEFYLDGTGTRRDPVEAGVLVWRVRHGRWSGYGDYGGLCKDCQGLWAREEVLARRVDHEMTRPEKATVDMLSASRFPELMARVQWWDHFEEMGASLMTAGGLIWFGWRGLRGSRNARERKSG